MPDETRVAALKEILAANPDDAFARYALGLEYSGSGETDAALAEFQRLLAVASRLHQRILHGRANSGPRRTHRRSARHVTARHRVRPPYPQPARSLGNGRHARRVGARLIARSRFRSNAAPIGDNGGSMAQAIYLQYCAVPKLAARSAFVRCYCSRCSVRYGQRWPKRPFSGKIPARHLFAQSSPTAAPTPAPAPAAPAPPASLAIPLPDVAARSEDLKRLLREIVRPVAQLRTTRRH